MNALYWREPAWALIALLPLLALAAARWRATRLRRRYAEPALWPWALGGDTASGAAWRRVALLTAWLLLALAAAGPRLPARLPPDAGAGQATLLIVLDLSRSMDANDVWPSRRRLALRALHGLLPQLAGSRAGLVVVAGRAHLLWPPSTDRGDLADLVARLAALRPPSRGSDLADGVRLALAQLAEAPGARQLLLLSDGDQEPVAQQTLARALAGAGGQRTRVLIAGVGTPGGAPLPGGDGDWLSLDGEPVLSRLDFAGLKAMAEAAGGSYLTLPSDDPARALRDALPERLLHPTLAADAPVAWHELFPWLLCPAMLLWGVALLRLPPLAAPAALGATTLYLAALGLALPVHAGGLAAAHRALAAGDTARALALFDAQTGYAARMGSGTSCYRREDWDCAQRAFTQAVLLAADDRARAAAIYNLAHARFQHGDFGGAAKLFDDALHYRPDYPAARHNRDFAAALAAEVARMAGGEQAERRPGRGPASGTAGTAPPAGQARIALAPEQAPQPPSGTASHQALINRGLAYTHLAASARGDAGAPWGQGYGVSQSDTQADISLWQTLLERAEGLPASPAEPLVLPGVRPW